jgi:hypothetical protein
VRRAPEPLAGADGIVVARLAFGSGLLCTALFALTTSTSPRDRGIFALQGISSDVGIGISSPCTSLGALAGLAIAPIRCYGTLMIVVVPSSFRGVARGGHVSTDVHVGIAGLCAPSVGHLSIRRTLLPT